MAINKNHEFEELDGVKCGIVEKNVPEQRVQFLKTLLQANGYTVIVVPSAPAKAAPKPADDSTATTEPTAALPATFTIGVTDYTFNTTNAIFGRLLKTNNGSIVTLAYWNQQQAMNDDEVPYFGSVVTE
jgi:hypothetical protein